MTSNVFPGVLEPASRAQRERELVQRHRRGEEEAFAEYYREFSGLIFNLTLRHSGDPEQAADLSQEILVKIFRSLGRFRCRSSLKTWTYRVCINHCRSQLGRRRLPTQSLESPEGAATELADPGRGPEELTLANEEGREVAAALPRVELVFREAVMLRDIEGLSYREIADILKVPLGTVRSRIARGREQLRAAVEHGRAHATDAMTTDQEPAR